MNLTQKAIAAYHAMRAHEHEEKRQQLEAALGVLGPLTRPARFEGREPEVIQPVYYLASGNKGAAVIALVDGLVFGCSAADELVVYCNGGNTFTVTSLISLGEAITLSQPDSLPLSAVRLPVYEPPEDEPYAVVAAEADSDTEPETAPKATPKPTPKPTSRKKAR